jgi:IclR family KDG regulon transcriptional repressor
MEQRSETGNGPRSESLSLQRGLDILSRLGTEAPLGVRDLARRCDLAPATVQRLVNTLAQGGWIEQDAATQRYRLGGALLAMADRVDLTDRMAEAARLVLAPLAERGLNGYLGVLRGSQALYLVSVQSTGPVAIRSRPGDFAKLHTTALGKALLAGLTDAQAAALLGPGPLEACTAQTLTDPAKVVAQLRRIRREGISVADNENIPGVLSLGAPVLDAQGRIVASVSVAYLPSAAPGENRARVVEEVRKAARRISAAIGGPSARGPSC